MPKVKAPAMFNAGALQNEGTVFIVEGVFDAIRLYPYMAVATLGKDVSESRIDRLVNATANLVIAFDGDAWESGKALSQRLLLRGKVSEWVQLPPGCDPGELGHTVLGIERMASGGK